MEIGVDIIEISRFEELIKNKNFLKKNFTQDEIDYCQNKFKPAENFAARFAGKEAIKKALTPFYDKKLDFNKIEIRKEKNGNPKVKILNKISQNIDVKISLSHSKKYVVGMAIISKKNQK